MKADLFINNVKIEKTDYLPSTNLPGLSFSIPSSVPGSMPVSSPIQEELLSFTSFDGAQLSAKWIVLEESPNELLLLLPGSGTVGTDGDISSPLLGQGFQGASAKLSDQLAFYFASRGLSTFRYAKRGYDDPAQVQNQTAPFLIQDVIAALRVMRDRFPHAKVGIVGFSEGALLSVLAAAQVPVDGLFLLSLLTRSLGEAIRYQFLEWPLQVLKKRLHVTAQGELSLQGMGSALESGVRFPLLGPGFQGLPWSEMACETESLSLEKSIIPAYEQNFKLVESLLATPAFSAWFESFDRLPAFPEIAQQVASPVYLYHGSEDAQFPWERVDSDRSHFRACQGLRVFKGLAHCFSPMEGILGEVKTSGPFDSEVLEALTTDIFKQFKRA